jgi:hypothetical protein
MGLIFIGATWIRQSALAKRLCEPMVTEQHDKDHLMLNKKDPPAAVVPIVA